MLEQNPDREIIVDGLPAGPAIMITSSDTVSAEGFYLHANVTPGDSPLSDCFVLAKLCGIWGGAPLYLRGEWSADEGVFSFGDDATARAVFRNETGSNVAFTVYAFDDNGLFAKAEKTIHFE